MDKKKKSERNYNTSLWKHKKNTLALSIKEKNTITKKTSKKISLTYFSQ